MFRSLRVKILRDLLIATLVPMGVAMLFASIETRSELANAGEQHVKLLAKVTASRLDQLMYDSQQVVQIVALNSAVQDYCAQPAQRPELQDEVQRILGGVVALHSDYSQLFIADANAMGIASTDIRNINQDLKTREYAQRALRGEPNMSHWLIGRVTAEPGVFFASPIRRNHEVVGFAALKLNGERVRQRILEVRLGSVGYAMLAEQSGIVIAHPDASKAFHSFGPLTEQQVAAIDPKTRFGMTTIESLGMPELQTALQGPVNQRLTHFKMPAERRGDRPTEWVAGMAEMREQQWSVLVVQPRKQFGETFIGLLKQLSVVALIVAAAGILLSLWRAHTVVKPLLSLTSASRKLAKGDFTARAFVTSTDEVGQLADTFNHMVPQLQQRVELQKSVELAHKIQQSLLPQQPPHDKGVEIAGKSHYCDATGGDYFDFAEAVDLPSGQHLIAVGDVTGHGLGAALVMCTARAALRAAAAEGGSMGHILSRVNQTLCQSVIEDMFMTMTIMHIDPEARTLRYACAAHEAIIVCNTVTGEVKELSEGSLPLGAMPGKQYEEYSANGLATGTVLFLGTDGIWEACNGADEMFGRARLVDAIMTNIRRSASEIGKAVEASLESFLNGRPIQDDVTYVVVKIL